DVSSAIYSESLHFTTTSCLALLAFTGWAMSQGQSPRLAGILLMIGSAFVIYGLIRISYYLVTGEPFPKNIRQYMRLRGRQQSRHGKYAG
ncbi:MAG: hypothetical protein K6T83_24070, partial [Alicyclobacillus sp.]|nr:hypothetical protein [Alicyclobacillus sp.]